MPKRVVLFDLDGTLTDPKEGICKSMQYALNACGVDVEDADSLSFCIGPPLRDTFHQHYGFSEEETERAVVLFREYFTKQGIFQNILYDGVVPLLTTLHHQGRSLAVATSKATVFTERILKHFGITSFFRAVAGAELDGKRSGKAEVIRHAMNLLRVSDPRDCVMIGDRKYDIMGAKTCGIDSIGVLYGYGDRKELVDAGANRLARNLPELGALLLGRKRDKGAAREQE